MPFSGRLLFLHRDSVYDAFKFRLVIRQKHTASYTA